VRSSHAAARSAPRSGAAEGVQDATKDATKDAEVCAASAVGARSGFAFAVVALFVACVRGGSVEEYARGAESSGCSGVFHFVFFARGCALARGARSRWYSYFIANCNNTIGMFSEPKFECDNKGGNSECCIL